MSERTYDHLTHLTAADRNVRLEQSRQYAREHGATVVEDNGKTRIDWPDDTPQLVIDGFDRILGLYKSEPTIVRLDYDDNAVDIIDKINKALASRDLQLVDDGQPHDGFMLLELRGGRDGDG